MSRFLRAVLVLAVLPSVLVADPPLMVYYQQPAAATNSFGTLLAMHNQERAARGLRPLAFDPSLCAEAQASAQAQASRGRVGHFLPLRAGGENSAAGQSSENGVHRSWMASPGHRSNVLSSGYTAVGFGRVGNFWAARFR